MLNQEHYDALKKGNSVAARETLIKQLQENPNQLEALFMLGSIYAERNKFFDARDLFFRAYQLEKNAPIIRFFFAICEEKCGNVKNALVLLYSLIEVDNDQRERAIVEYARVLLNAEQYEKVIDFGNEYGIAAHRPAVMMLWAKAMACVNRFDEAYDTLKPSFVKDIEVVGFALWCYDFYRYDLAIPLLQTIQPGSTSYFAAVSNIIQSYIALQEYEKADALNDYILPQCVSPASDAAHLCIIWNKILFDLGLGRFKAAIPLYHDIRWDTPNFVSFKRFYTNLPVWQGQDIGGKSLLIQCEQGIGDQLFFASYIPYLKDLGITLYLSCNNRLASIFQRAFPYVHVISEGAELLEPEWVNEQRKKGISIDYVVDMGSLFHLLPLQDTAYAAPAYLSCNETLAAQMRTALQQEFPGKKLVGFTWYSQGENGEHRSLPAAACAPLFEVEDCVLVNVQYGDITRHLAKFSKINPNYKVAQITNLDINTDFDNLSALLKALDGVITIGNTTAYFINYLNIPNITLVNADAGWRYGFQGSTTPWLSNLTITRERVSGDWRAPIADAVAFMQGL